MGFNFSEEEIGSAFALYQRALGAVQEETMKTIESIIGWTSKVKYEQAVKLTKDAVDFYNNALKRAEVKALEDWQESDASFTHFIELLHAGEEAKERSRQLERKIADEIQSWKSIDDSGLNSINTTNFTIDQKDFEEIKNIISRFNSAMDEAQQQYDDTISSKADENRIYLCIRPVVCQSFNIVSAGFTEGIQESYKALADDVSDKEREFINMAESSSNEAASRSRNYINDGAAELISKIKSMLD